MEGRFRGQNTLTSSAASFFKQLLQILFGFFETLFRRFSGEHLLQTLRPQNRHECRTRKTPKGRLQTAQALDLTNCTPYFECNLACRADGLESADDFMSISGENLSKSLLPPARAALKKNTSSCHVEKQFFVCVSAVTSLCLYGTFAQQSGFYFLPGMICNW